MISSPKTPRTHTGPRTSATGLARALLLGLLLPSVFSPARAQVPAAPLIPPPSVTPAAPPAAAPVLNLPVAPTPAAPLIPQTAPAPSGKIAKITVQGNVNIRTEAIRAVMAQKEGEPYNATTAERDQDAIKNMGYFNGEIGLSAVANGSGGVDVTYTVVENPVIRQIKFTANTDNGQPSISADKLKSLMQTKEGQVLNLNTLLTDFDHLFNSSTSYAAQQGYLMNVSADINLDPTNNVLTIPLIEAHVQAIEVKGNKKTKKSVVTREFRTRPGDVYNERKVQRDITKVYGTGLFDNVTYDLIPTDAGQVIISVNTPEKRSGQVTVGVGYSSRQKLVGRAELAENNFRGVGERVSLIWEVGGVASSSTVEFNFFEPYLDKRHTSLDVSVYNRAIYRFSSSTFGNTTSGTDNTYIEQRKGGSLGISRPVGDTSTIGLTARTESVSVNDVEVPAGEAFIRQKGTVSAFGVRGVNNTRDNDFNPAAGGLRSLSFEVGTADTRTVGNTISPLAPGRQTFGKLGIDARQYISLQGPRKPGNFREPKRVVAVRLLIGAANDKLPFFEQYFLGGPDSLRGYQNDRFWGSKLLLFQSELRIPIGKGDTIQGVLLFDFGDAWGSLYQGGGLLQHRGFSPAADYGIGFRLNTPIGPIRLDYAIPAGGGSGRTQFSIGPSF